MGGLPEPGCWLVDAWHKTVHWVEPGEPVRQVREGTYVYNAVCDDAALRILGGHLVEEWPRCNKCETWLKKNRSCPQCQATGRVRVYRRRDHGPVRRFMETCGMCDGHGYRAGGPEFVQGDN